MASAPPRKKTILITGATGGIGRATALAFAKTGEYNLALHYNSAPQELRDHLTRIFTQAIPSPATTTVAFFRADFSSYASVRGLHLAVEREFGEGAVDVLFSNAGTTGGIRAPNSLAEVDVEETFEQTWRVNAGAGFLLTQLCLPGMEKRKWGRVVFCSSVAALTGGFVGPHYASSKSAIHGYVHWLGNNVARKGISVNAIAPALIADTAMLPDRDAEEADANLAQRLPVGRLGRPEEIAETVLWMVKTPYVTKKIITVDGGMYPC